MKYLFPIVAALALIAAVVVWLRYRQWPPQIWARRVHGRVAELRERLDLLLHPRGNERSAAERLADELFGQQTAGVSVAALSRYDNVGPKTVEWLESAGIRTLPQAEDHVNAFLFKKKIQNVGEFREKALANAVRALLVDERHRFDDGRSPQGQQYQSRLVQLGAEEQERAAAKQREREAIERCLAAMKPLQDMARDVTFSTYLLKQPIPGLTAEVMAEALPSVEIVASRERKRPEEATAPVADAPGSPKPLPGVAKLQAYCRFALLMAKADGRIAQAERGRIRVALGEQFGSDPVLLRHLDPQLEAAEADLPSEADAVAAIKLLVAKEERLALYAFAEQVADAAGERVEKEKQFLARLAEAFELEVETPKPAPTPEAPKPPPTSPVSTARDVLGIPAGAEITVDLVRRKYTMLTEQICPEKAAQLGPEFAAMAVGKRAAIQAAAEELLKPFDAPLDKPAPPEQKNMRENSDLDHLFGSLNRG